MNFLVKICGITRPEDAAQAVAAGADLIGLNFWRGSKRFVPDDQAREIIAAIPKGVLRVGVFVNAHPLVVSETVEELKLDRVQLHGGEIPTTWNWLRPEQIIRTIRARDQASLKEALGWEASLFLYDAYAEGYGGSGKRAPWEVVAEGARRPFLIAGGLNPSNVTQAIEATSPDGVDVSSGVESAPGIKDTRKLRAFIKSARAAAARLK
ncbi:MAG: phosphoribosylanthranilate isomerase [Polyangia bacterium]